MRERSTTPWHVGTGEEVLMDNHYHFLFQTPEPNLVQGMSWFQNTWTRRFNARHKLWGHLFGGRYKAKPVEEGEYLSRLLAYIHLNPVRAGLVKRRDGLESYPWCSLADYVKPPSKRSSWVAVERGLVDRRRSGYTGAQTRDHGEAEAERVVSLAQEEMGFTDWSALKKGDWRKGLVANLIRKRSLADNGWLAKRLSMGARSAVSRIMGEARERMRKDRKLKALARCLEKRIAEP